MLVLSALSKLIDANERAGLATRLLPWRAQPQNNCHFIRFKRKARSMLKRGVSMEVAANEAVILHAHSCEGRLTVQNKTYREKLPSFKYTCMRTMRLR